MFGKVVRQILAGVSAGVMITIGCCIYLATENKVVGAVLFAVALLTICYRGYSLYTGKIGFMAEKHGKEEFSVLLLGLLGNTVAMVLLGLAVAYALPSLKETAIAACEKKLETQTFMQTFVRGCFCGVLMYVAVSLYRDKKTPLGILFGIPVFILAGFEHSIADMGYFAIAMIYSWEGFAFIWAVILGNTVGGLLLPLLKAVCPEKSKETVPSSNETTTTDLAEQKKEN